MAAAPRYSLPEQVSDSLANVSQPGGGVSGGATAAASTNGCHEAATIACTWPGGCSHDMLGRKNEMAWSNMSKWPARPWQKEAVRASIRPSPALKKAFRSAASSSARPWWCVPAFVSKLTTASSVSPPAACAASVPFAALSAPPAPTCRSVTSRRPRPSFAARATSSPLTPALSGNMYRSSPAAPTAAARASMAATCPR